MNTTHLHEVYISILNNVWTGNFILNSRSFWYTYLNNIKSFYFDKVLVTCLTLRTFERGDK